MRARLLLVDDSTLIRVTTRVMFEEFYDVIEASNGIEALNLIDETIDIILMDLYMPIMGGLEVIERIKADSRWNNIPIIVITSSEEIEDQLKAFEMGINDYMAKPINPQIAVHRVNNVVESNKRMLKIMEERKFFLKKSEIDGLTGVYNKATTEIKIVEVLKAENKKRHALFIFDIDHFKEINDESGHLFGDDTLKAVANLISSNFASTDIVGRIGGDEFIVLMENAEEDLLVQDKAEDLLRLLYYKSNLTITETVTISIGIAFTDANCNEYHTLFKKADDALYYSKKNGRNRYHIYDCSDE